MLVAINGLFILGAIGLIIALVLFLLVLLSNIAHSMGAHVPDYKATLKAFVITSVTTCAIWVIAWILIAFNHL